MEGYTERKKSSGGHVRVHDASKTRHPWNELQGTEELFLCFKVILFRKGKNIFYIPKLFS